MAIFAPTANAYRRYRPGVFVPMTPNWGINHRGVALRIPLSAAEDTRIEHRPGGADGNPYLVMAAIMAGIHHGITNRCDPAPMVSPGEVHRGKDDAALRWEAALDAFEAGNVLPRYLGERYHKLYATCRREECDRIPCADQRSRLRVVSAGDLSAASPQRPCRAQAPARDVATGIRSRIQSWNPASTTSLSERMPCP